VLYLNYAALEKWKNSSCIINHLTNNIPTISYYSWTKESRTLDKKLNGRKTSEIKKVLLGKRFLQTLQSYKSNYLLGG